MVRSSRSSQVSAGTPVRFARSAPDLTWTAAAPTEPGWYWVLASAHDDPRVVYVLTFDGDQLIESQSGMDVRKTSMHCWAGPISSPKLASPQDSVS